MERERGLRKKHAESEVAQITRKNWAWEYKIKEKRLTFFVCSTKPVIGPNVIKMDVGADDQVRQTLFVDSGAYKFPVVSTATSRVYQDTFILPHDHIHEGELPKTVLLHH